MTDQIDKKTPTIDLAALPGLLADIRSEIKDETDPHKSVSLILSVAEWRVLLSAASSTQRKQSDLYEHAFRPCANCGHPFQQHSMIPEMNCGNVASPCEKKCPGFDWGMAGSIALEGDRLASSTSRTPWAAGDGQVFNSGTVISGYGDPKWEERVGVFDGNFKDSDATFVAWARTNWPRISRALRAAITPSAEDLKKLLTDIEAQKQEDDDDGGHTFLDRCLELLDRAAALARLYDMNFRLAKADAESWERESDMWHRCAMNDSARANRAEHALTQKQSVNETELVKELRHYRDALDREDDAKFILAINQAIDIIKGGGCAK